MISVSVRYIVKNECSEQFLKRISEHAKTTFIKEEECIFFDYCKKQDAENEFFVYEIYKSVDGLENHKQSDHSKAFSNDVKDWLIERSLTVWDRVGSGGQ